MWEVIISSAISLIAGGGIMQLINWKANKKKAVLENDSTAVDNLNKVIDTLERSNSHFEEVNKQREDELAQLRREVIECEGDLTLATSYICGKCGCKFRLPPSRGNGRQYIEKLKSGEEIPDYEPVKCN